jgi:hypothetical protein
MCGSGQRLRSIAAAALLTVICVLASAQSPQQKSSAPQDKEASADQNASDENQAKALAKAVQNPVASLISVPLQNNTNFDIGPNNRTQNILNIQPVIPVHVSKNWNLIMRIHHTCHLSAEHSFARLSVEHSPESSGDFGLG